MAIALRLVLLCLFISASVFAQEVSTERTEPKKCKIEVKYDRFKDQTTELCGNLVMDNALEGLTSELFSMNGVARYRGNTRSKPVSIELNVLNVQMQRGVAKPRFSEAKELYLLTDSERMVLPLNRLTPTIEVSLTGEAFIVPLSKPFVEALIRAKSVEGRIGLKEFRFKETEMRQFQGFLKELLPLLPPSAPPARP